MRVQLPEVGIYKRKQESKKKRKKIDQEIDQEKKENNLSCTRLILIISRSMK